MGFLDDDFNSDEARYNRMNRTNPAEFAPGQGSNSFGSDDLFSSNVSSSGSNFGGSDLFSGAGTSPLGGDIFGGAGGLNSLNPTPQPIQQPQQSEDDKIFEAIKGVGISIFDFVKDIPNIFKGVTPLYWTKCGYTCTLISVAVIVVGIVARLFGAKIGLQIAIGGCLSAATGSIAWFFTSEKSRSFNSEYADENNTMQNFNTPSPMMDSAPSGASNDMGNSDKFDFSNSFSNDFSSDAFSSNDFSNNGGDEDEDEDEDDFDISSEDSDDDIWDMADDTGAEDGLDTEEALNTLQEVPQGMYTRRYLYDAFMKRLPKMNPNFSEMRTIDEDEDVFLATEEKLQEAAGVVGCKEDNLPSLLVLEENLFTLRITCDRTVGFKPEAVASELANIYAYENGRFNPNVYAKSDTVGANCIITIFKGETAMISTKDMILQVEDFFLDSNNYIPVVVGTDQLGNVIHADFKNIESILITGMPRSGKSWFVQNILTQMCALVSPKELNIYICDPKDGISDFKSFCLPHVKKFVSGDDNIVNTLRQVVKELAPKRKKIIGDASCVNIWDYKKKYPDVEMPLIYILIDEVVTLAERMEKEVKQEFQGLLVELISQLPALGIRAFLIPHVVKNDIIAKTATDLIPCRISVMGDAGHIESSCGTKPKDFPYKLANKGDMAVRISVISPDTQFVHGPALTASNPENNDVFDYLRRVWTKLEGDSVKDSVAKDKDFENAQAELLKSSNEVDDTNIDFGTEESLDVDSNSELFTNPSERNLSGLNDSSLNSFMDDDDDFFN